MAIGRVRLAILTLVLSAGLAPCGLAQTSGSAPPPAAAAPAQPKHDDVAPPADPVAAKAFAVLDKHCARCHQSGRLKRPAPAGELADILRLERVAADLSLVQRGNADASRLVNVMLAREMPFDIHQEGAAGEGPSGEEIQAVRAWIDGLPRGPRCPGRTPISMTRVMELAAGAAEAAPEGAAKGLRFISLAHLYNNCASDGDLALYRMALTKLVNSLSWKREPVKLAAVDAGGTLLSLSLADAGWVGAHWEMLGYAYPYGFLPDTAAARRAAEATGTAIPVVRGDWLARAAGRAPLYYDLLGLPTRAGELNKVLGLEGAGAETKRELRRAGILGSTVMRGQRLIERVDLETSVLWRTYDFNGVGERPVDLIETPLPLPAKKGFQHDLALSLFALPNGLPAYYVAHASGARLDMVPAGALRHRGAREGGLAAGAPCMTCHGDGLRKFRDDLRANVIGDARVDRETQDLVAALHPPPEEMDKLVERDSEAFTTALKSIGVDPAATIRGLEPISGLARIYAERVDLARLAAELGLAPTALVERLKDAPAAVQRLLARLEQGALERAEVEDAQALVAPHIGWRSASVTAGLAPVKAPTQQSPYSLTLLADRPSYRPGDLVTFTVASTRDCNLTVISIDKAGRATVIFPNEFEQKNAIAAGRELRLPGDRAPYQFRARESGRESVVAICNSANAWAEGIVHDYERQRFTVLGDYAAFLAKGEAGNAPRPNAVPRRRPNGSNGSEGDPRPAGKDIARTAIVIDIR